MDYAFQKVGKQGSILCSAFYTAFWDIRIEFIEFYIGVVYMFS